MSKQKKLKVWGGRWRGKWEVIASATKKEAAELLRVSMNHFNEFGGLTANQADIDAALANPGQILSDKDIKDFAKSPKRQPAPGVFVPKSEVERLRREVEDAWRESDFEDTYEAVRDFLKAIDKEGGQNE